MNDFAKRLISLKKEGERKKDFAERIGILPQVLSRYLKKGREPSLEIIIRISRATGVNPNWLQFGHEPKEWPEQYNIVDRTRELLDMDAPAPGPDAPAHRPYGEAPLVAIGAKTTRRMDPGDWVEVVCAHVDNIEDWSREEQEIVKDLVRSIHRDPGLRAELLHYFDYLKYKGGKK